MAKTGRNDPCPCGSGNKYKKCCLMKDEAAERERLATIVQPAPPLLRLDDVAGEINEMLAAAYNDIDDLMDASNAVVDLVHGGKLDEAEQAARDLLVRYPDVHDGYERLGMVHEARGENRQAAECYRKVIEVVRQHPDDYDAEFQGLLVKLIDKLDPSANA